MPTARVAVRGSDRKLPEDSTVIGVADPNDEINLTIVVRRKGESVPPPRAAPGPPPQVRRALWRRPGRCGADRAVRRAVRSDRGSGGSVTPQYRGLGNGCPH